MRYLIIALSATTIVAGLAGLALAQASFESVDADGNGGITLAEASDAGMDWTEDQFAQADQNGDGVLNAEEFAAATQ
ncbi:MAG: EF-hand domain-containing protein [Pseudomonadota bacterium]